MRKERGGLPDTKKKKTRRVPNVIKRGEFVPSVKKKGLAVEEKEKGVSPSGGRGKIFKSENRFDAGGGRDLKGGEKS